MAQVENVAGRAPVRFQQLVHLSAELGQGCEQRHRVQVALNGEDS